MFTEACWGQYVKNIYIMLKGLIANQCVFKES